MDTLAGAKTLQFLFLLFFSDSVTGKSKFYSNESRSHFRKVLLPREANTGIKSQKLVPFVSVDKYGYVPIGFIL